MKAILGACRAVVSILFDLLPVCFTSLIAHSLWQSRGGCLPPGKAEWVQTAYMYGVTSKHPTTESGKWALFTLTHPEISLRLAKSRARSTDQFSQISPSLNDHSQGLNFMDGGYKLVWLKIQVIVNSATAYDRHHRIYDKILQNVEQPELDGNIATIALTYGSLDLRVEGLPHKHLAKRELLQQLALQILSLYTVGIVFAAYQVVVIMAKADTWVTLRIIEAGPIPELIGRWSFSLLWLRSHPLADQVEIYKSAHIDNA